MNIFIVTDWRVFCITFDAHPHSGWFFVSHASRAQLGHDPLNKSGLPETARKMNCFGINKPRGNYSADSRRFLAVAAAANAASRTAARSTMGIVSAVFGEGTSPFALVIVSLPSAKVTV